MRTAIKVARRPGVKNRQNRQKDKISLAQEALRSFRYEPCEC